MKTFFLYVMAFSYVLAGLNHFWHPQFYLKIIPHVLPYHNAINMAAGVAELVLALLLLPKATRSAAAWCMAILLVIVFPANVQMAVDYTKENHPQTWAAYLRLPLQPLLIWWALSYTKWYGKERRRKRNHSLS